MLPWYSDLSNPNIISNIIGKKNNPTAKPVDLLNAFANYIYILNRITVTPRGKINVISLNIIPMYLIPDIPAVTRDTPNIIHDKTIYLESHICSDNA